MSSAPAADVLAGAKYISLESYRRTGTAVRTPVWFAVNKVNSEPVYFVYSLADAGKTKRIRRDGMCRIAACDMRGQVTGPWLDARAEIVTGTAAEAGMRLINRKYWPWKQMLDLSVKLFSRHERAVIAIRLRP